MSASEEQRAEWLDPRFWDRLDRLEGRHQRLQVEHEDARRTLERVTSEETEALRAAWRRYCEVITELDQTTAQFEALRNGSAPCEDPAQETPDLRDAGPVKPPGTP